MYKHNTFSEILKLLDRSVVKKSVDYHKSDKYSKGFSTWNQWFLVNRVDGRGSKWTESTETSRGKGLKLHIQYASNSHLIEHDSITSN